MDKRAIILAGIGGLGAFLYYYLRGAKAKSPTPAPPAGGCSEGQTTCSGYNLYKCVNGKWILSEANSKQCGYTPAPTPTPTPISPTPTKIFNVPCGWFDKKSWLYCKDNNLYYLDFTVPWSKPKVIQENSKLCTGGTNGSVRYYLSKGWYCYCDAYFVCDDGGKWYNKCFVTHTGKHKFRVFSSHCVDKLANPDSSKSYPGLDVPIDIFYDGKKIDTLIPTNGYFTVNIERKLPVAKIGDVYYPHRETHKLGINIAGCSDKPRLTVDVVFMEYPPQANAYLLIDRKFTSKKKIAIWKDNKVIATNIIDPAKYTNDRVVFLKNGVMTNAVVVVAMDYGSYKVGVCPADTPDYKCYPSHIVSFSQKNYWTVIDYW